MGRLGLVVAVLSLAVATMAHAHEDVLIGLDGKGALKGYPGGHAFELDPSGGAYPGWFAEHPAFVSNHEDDPANDLYMLPEDAEVVLRIVSLEPALKIYDGLLNQMLPGDTWRLSPNSPPFGDFHTHPFWHIDSSDPAYDPNQTEWHGVFTVFDANEDYPESEPFTVALTIPEPASLVLLASAGLAALRRRRV